MKLFTTRMEYDFSETVWLCGEKGLDFIALQMTNSYSITSIGDKSIDFPSKTERGL